MPTYTLSEIRHRLGELPAQDPALVEILVGLVDCLLNMERRVNDIERATRYAHTRLNQ